MVVYDYISRYLSKLCKPFKYLEYTKASPSTQQHGRPLFLATLARPPTPANKSTIPSPFFVKVFARNLRQGHQGFI